MALEISGKVIQLLPEQTGTGKNGQWIRRDFIIETSEQYPRKVCFAAWGDKADLVKPLQQGTFVKVSFNVESREFNNRWYTDLKVWKIEGGEESGSPLPSAMAAEDHLEPLSPGEASGSEDDGLPF